MTVCFGFQRQTAINSASNQVSFASVVCTKKPMPCLNTGLAPRQANKSLTGSDVIEISHSSFIQLINNELALYWILRRPCRGTHSIALSLIAADYFYSNRRYKPGDAISCSGFTHIDLNTRAAINAAAVKPGAFNLFVKRLFSPALFDSGCFSH